MKINVQSVHFDADKKLISFINEKVAKLSQFNDRITMSDVILKIDNSKESENKIAELKVAIPGKELFAKRQCKTFEEAVDTSVEALRNQIKKHKGRLASR